MLNGVRVISVICFLEKSFNVLFQFSDVNRFLRQVAKPNTVKNVKLRKSVKVRQEKRVLKFLIKLVNKLK